MKIKVVSQINKSKKQTVTLAVCEPSSLQDPSGSLIVVLVPAEGQQEDPSSVSLTSQSTHRRRRCIKEVL